jgi:ketosteroid isomerase-like protein
MDRFEAPGFMLTDGANSMQKTKPRAATMKPRKADRTWTMDDVKVNVAGDTAILTSHHVWNMNDGRTDERRVTEVWRRDGGQWRILAGHSSEVPVKK